MANVDDKTTEARPEYMLTTVDNPYNPFTDFDSWLVWDEGKGYRSSELLARIAVTSDELPEADLRFAINAAIDEIVAENVLGVFRKVSSTDTPPTPAGQVVHADEIDDQQLNNAEVEIQIPN